MEPVIERLLIRQEEQMCKLSQVHRDGDDRKELKDLWSTLTSPVYEVYADYPTHTGEWEQQPSGVEVRRADDDIWLATDETEGFYLVSQDEVGDWMLVVEEE